MMWKLRGDSTPGNEFYYESADGQAQVFLHPDSGWELQVRGEDETRRFPAKRSAFLAYEPNCTMLQLTPEGTTCGKPATVAVLSEDGTLVHTFCTDCAKWGA